MATPYSKIFDVFTSLVTDYNFLNFNDADLDKLFTRFLTNAIPEFVSCKQDLSARDDTSMTFTTTELTSLEIQILANMMVLSWIKPLINNIELAKQVIPDKEFRLYSQANHLAELLKLKSDQEEDIDRLIIAYSYQDGLDKLR